MMDDLVLLLRAVGADTMHTDPAPKAPVLETDDDDDDDKRTGAVGAGQLKQNK